LKILFAASEALPFIKVGGLGDVLGALPKALQRMGHEVHVVLPLYSKIGEKERKKAHYRTHFTFRHAWRDVYCGIFDAQINGVTYHLIDNEQYFKRDRVYGEFDDGERFAFFSKAVLEILPKIDFFPDILHANDWHTALVPVYLDAQYRLIEGYNQIRTVFSIHNIEFQGKYDPYILGSVFGLDNQFLPLLTHDKCLNLMKGAIESANRVTTVSESYAAEILDPYFSFGLDTILKPRAFKLSGIVNGIDQTLFNPATDRHLVANYNKDDPTAKAADKAALQEELGLPKRPDVPMIAMVTRLTPQKGVELFFPILSDLLREDLQLVILGTGYPEYEHFFESFTGYFPDKIRTVAKFDAGLAQRFYAGADLFLMPSKSEPCGLAQMIAMRYGTLPIVHTVGGLKDTVIPFDHTTVKGNGITFCTFNSYDMMDAIHRACDLYRNSSDYAIAQKNAMKGDYSWKTSAKKYEAIYKELL